MSRAEGYRAHLPTRTGGLRGMLGPERKKRVRKPAESHSPNQNSAELGGELQISVLAHASSYSSPYPPLASSNQDRVTQTRKPVPTPKTLPIAPSKPSKIPTSSFSATPRTTGFTPLAPTPEGVKVEGSRSPSRQRERDTPSSSRIRLGPAGNNENTKKWETDASNTKQTDAGQEGKPGPPAATTSKTTRKQPPPPLETSYLETKFTSSTPLIPLLSFRGSNLFDDEGSKSWLVSPNTGSSNSNFLTTPMSAAPTGFELDRGSSTGAKTLEVVKSTPKDSVRIPEKSDARPAHTTSNQAASNIKDQVGGRHSPTFDYGAFPKTPTSPAFQMTLPPLSVTTGIQEQQEKHSRDKMLVDSKRVSISFSFRRGRNGRDVSPVSPLSQKAEHGERLMAGAWNSPDPSSTVNAASQTSPREPIHFADVHRTLNDPLGKIPSPGRSSKEIRDVSMLKLHTIPSEAASLSVLSPTRSHFSSDSSRASSRSDSSRPSSGRSQASHVSTLDVDYHSFLVNSYYTSRPPPSEESEEESIDIPQAADPPPSEPRASKLGFWHFKRTSKAPLATRARDSLLLASSAAPAATKVLTSDDHPTAKGARLKQKFTSHKPGSNAKAEQILGTSIARMLSPEPGPQPANSAMQTSPNPNSPERKLGERTGASIDSSTRYESTSTAMTDGWSKGYQNGRSTGDTTPTEYSPPKSQAREIHDRKATVAAGSSIRFPLKVATTRRQKSLPALPDKVTDVDIPMETLPIVVAANAPTTVVKSDAKPPKDVHRKQRPLSPQPATGLAAVEGKGQTRNILPKPTATSPENSAKMPQIVMQTPNDNENLPLGTTPTPGFGAKSRINPLKPAPLQLNPKLRPFLLPTMSASRLASTRPASSVTAPEDKAPAPRSSPADRFSQLRIKANELSIDKVDPITKVLVVCCSCRHFQDLLERDYAVMMRAERVSPYGGVGGGKVAGVGGGGGADQRVECRCGHAMTTVCCEGYSAVVYLRKRLH